MKVPQRHRRYRPARRGAIVVFTAFLMIVLLALAALLLGMAYIELSRTELQAAADATARSAVIALGLSQSQEDARAVATDIAGRFRVGGQDYAIADEDIVFGSATRQPDGSFAFTGATLPTNAVRIAGRKTSGSPAGPIQLPMGGFLGHTVFEAQLPAVAMRLDHDVCLVLDRSGSMAWDLSNQRFSYPESIANRPLLERYFSPPDPIESRWGVLAASVNEFLGVLEERDVSARVGLVTFASDYEFGKYRSERVSLESDLTASLPAVADAVESIGRRPAIGATDIAAGLREAETLLTTSAARRPLTAHPSIILFSDGIFNEGDNPVELAATLNEDYGIVIHSVTFGAEAPAMQTMDDIARTAGNGLSFHATSAEEMIEAFRLIANAIPVLVIQ